MTFVGYVGNKRAVFVDKDETYEFYRHNFDDVRDFDNLIIGKKYKLTEDKDNNEINRL